MPVCRSRARSYDRQEARPLRSLRSRKSLISGNTSSALSSRTKWPVSNKWNSRSVMFERQAPADGRSIVHDVDGISRHLQLVERTIDQFAETVERIGERPTIGGIALPVSAMPSTPRSIMRY